MKTWGIIGALLFVVACVFGYLFSFNGSDLITIALAGFAVTAACVGFIEKQKDKEKLGWKTYLVLALCLVSGVLVCIGGLSQNIFAELSGAIIALMTIIFGLIYSKK